MAWDRQSILMYSNKSAANKRKKLIHWSPSNQNIFVLQKTSSEIEQTSQIWRIARQQTCIRMSKEPLQVQNITQISQLKSEQNIGTDISPKKIYRWPISTREDAQCHYLLGKCNLKGQWTTTSDLLGWLKSKTDNKDWQGGGDFGTPVHCWWNVKWYDLSGKHFGSFLKSWYALSTTYH